MQMQLNLFDAVRTAYSSGALTNEELYQKLTADGVIASEDLNTLSRIGRAQAKHSCTKRRIRWIQQSLKQIGAIEPAKVRGLWRMTDNARNELTPAQPKMVLLGFSTNLGMALWASCESVFPHLNEPISLMLTSPPYPLHTPRNYGNPTESQYVDWLCGVLEPIVKNLVPGGSIVLNVSNDIFISKSPARSLYRERLVLALNERFGLQKLDELIWHNPCKPPAPIEWACKRRFQLAVAYEPIYIFTNDPLSSLANNQRILEPHTEQHMALMRAGGEKIARTNGDGSQVVRAGSYGVETKGRIPRNILNFPHRCKDQNAYKSHCKQVGLPSHGASMPLELAVKLVKYLTEPGDLVVDPCAGSLTSGKASELTGRRWLVTDKIREYVMGGSSRFEKADGFYRTW